MSAKPLKKKAKRNDKGPPQKATKRPSPAAYTQEDIRKALEDFETYVNFVKRL